MSRFDEGRTELHKKLSAFLGTGAAALGVLQQSKQPVDANSHQKQPDRYEGLPETSDQALGMPGVDAGDGSRVVAEQPCGFDEIPELLGHRCGVAEVTPLLNEVNRRYGRPDHRFCLCSPVCSCRTLP